MAQTSGYASNKELPAEVRKQLSDDAQDVYRIAFNSSLASGKKDGAASKAAWETVGRGWKKSGKTWTQRAEVVA